MIKTSFKFHRLIILLLCLLPLTSVTLAQDCSQLAANYRQSVVSLSVEKTKKETGVVTSANGTGFIVSEEGYVLTAYHVVARDPDEDSVKIDGAIGSLYGQKSPLIIITTDKTRDLALLAFRDSGTAYKPIPLSNPFKVAIGGQLCALSYAAPLEADYQATTGTLSSRKGRDEIAGITNLWTTQIPSNPGESGAPVLELSKGGVVALKYGGKPPGLAQNVNYLNPINMARTLLEDYCGVRIPEGEDNSIKSKSEPTLQSVQVRFLSEGEDKDFDTMVAVSIKKGNIIVASHDDIASKINFLASGTYGPFNLDVQPDITKAIYSDTIVQLSISPVGHDRWAARLIIEAKFSDNKVVKSEFGPFIVDQDMRKIQFKNP